MKIRYFIQLLNVFYLFNVSFQLHLGVESVRAPEIMFQPNMIGSCEAGITETINYVLKQFSYEDQFELSKNIYVTGSCAQFPGLKERLQREIMEIRPFQSTFNINIATNPSLDAWISAKNITNLSNFNDMMMTKNDYIEGGGEYFKEHKSSNQYFPTPAPIDATITSSQTSITSINDIVGDKMEEDIFIDDQIIE